tara:strand:- start:2214 stop:3494 length:1281 start_codon:yes stop_codon:yes gene_type:complete
MARTVTRNQTLEEFRGNYNKLANDVGTISGLVGTINNNNNLVDAINELENKTFFFDNFTFTASASQTVFNSSHESDNKTVKLRTGRFQVFKNGSHLNEGNDYSVGAYSGGISSSITLNSGASAGDIINIYTFTGSVVGEGGGAGSGTGQFTETAANTIYNINDSGVILNGSSSGRTTVLESGYTIQLAGKTFAEDDVISTVSGKKVQFPIVSDGTATITGGVGSGFSSITSTAFAGNLTGNVTGDVTGDVKHSGSVVLDASTGALTGTVSSITNHQITDLSDVSTTAPSNGQILAYNSSSSQYEPVDKQTTTTVSEGTNLYFTNERAMDAAAGMITSATHSNITVSYDDASNTLAFSAASQYDNSNVQSYLTGGAGIDFSNSGVISVNTSNGVKIDVDDVELDYEVVSSAPTGVGSSSVGHLWFVI